MKYQVRFAECATGILIDSQGKRLNGNEPFAPLGFGEKQTALDFAELYVRLNPDRECWVVDENEVCYGIFRPDF